MKVKALSILELLLAIAISAAIMIAAVRYYSEVSSNQKLTALESQANTLYKAVVSCVAQQSPSAEGNLDNCFNESWMSTTANYLTASNLVNPWGGANALSNSTTSEPPQVRLVFQDVPSSMCDRLNTRMVSSLPTSTYIGMASTNYGTQCVADIPLG